MGDVELVIKIPEGAYNLLKTSGVDWLGAEHILDAVSKGTPLPENHGRLADLDAALKCVEEVTDSKEKEYAISLFDWAMSKRVIIPATKEGDGE